MNVELSENCRDTHRHCRMGASVFFTDAILLKYLCHILIIAMNNDKKIDR